jgi:hypothetical protein
VSLWKIALGVSSLARGCDRYNYAVCRFTIFTSKGLAAVSIGKPVEAFLLRARRVGLLGFRLGLGFCCHD